MPACIAPNTKYQYRNYYYFAAIKHADKRTYVYMLCSFSINTKPRTHETVVQNLAI